MSQPRHVPNNKYNRNKPPPKKQYIRNGQPAQRRRVIKPHPKHSNTSNNKNKKSSKSSIPTLPRIKRLSVQEEIALAEGVGMDGMTSHNIASIVNKGRTETSNNVINNFLSEFIWEDDMLHVINDTPPHYLTLAAKMKIAPCRRKRVTPSKTKLTPFKSIKDLKTHRFHLAELFQNDDETKKDLSYCFKTVPSYYFANDYETLPSKNKQKDSDSDSESDREYKIDRKSRVHKLLLRDCKNHKILATQKKLGDYLDIVEVNLLKQICIQSESFFTGLDNIQLLQNDVYDILSNIKYLRTNLHRMEQYEVMSWAKCIDLSIKQVNYNKMLDILENIQNLQILQKNLNKLISENKYESCVHILTQCKLIVGKYKNGINVINKFEKRLNKIQQTLSIKLIYKICDISIQINEKILSNKKSKHNNKRMVDNKLNEMCENHIKSCILLQDPSKSVQTIYNTLQNRFNTKISEILCHNKQEKIGNYLVNKSMEMYIENISDNSLYISILQQIYFMSESILLSMQSICDIFTTYLMKSSFGGNKYKHINKIAHESYKNNSSTYCKSLCDEILNLCSLLLQCRDNGNSLMTLYELKSVFAKTLSFLQNIESITNTTCYDIRGVLLKQAQSFLDKFHKQRINKLNKSLEYDKWTSVKVPMDVQIEVTRIQSGEKKQNISFRDDHRNIDTKDAILIHIDDKKLLCKTSMSENINEDGSINDDIDSDYYDDVDDIRFKSVSSLLCLINLIYEYIECAGKLPPIAYDVENKLIELFTLFNSKTCQLVLGAGAMQTVNLKAITAKHLALAQQSISVLIILLPQIHQKWFIQIIPRNCLPLIMAQINRLNEDLEQHSNEIFKKLISIMESLINYKFDGNEQYQSYLLTQTIQSTKQHKVHPSISTLMIECKKMHRLMLTYMQSYQIQIIFKPIVAQFELKLTALISKIQAVHLDKNNSNNQNDENNNEGDSEDKMNVKIRKPPKRDMTQAFHSLNMSIKFISDKLNRLNCEAQHLANLCIEID